MPFLSTHDAEGGCQLKNFPFVQEDAFSFAISIVLLGI